LAAVEGRGNAMVTRVIDGRRCYIAEVTAGGVFVVDGERFKKIGFISTASVREDCIPVNMIRNSTYLSRQPRDLIQ
jgi:hypothetical protein